MCTIILVQRKSSSRDLFQFIWTWIHVQSVNLYKNAKAENEGNFAENSWQGTFCSDLSKDPVCNATTPILGLDLYLRVWSSDSSTSWRSSTCLPSSPSAGPRSLAPLLKHHENNANHMTGLWWGRNIFHIQSEYDFIKKQDLRLQIINKKQNKLVRVIKRYNFFITISRNLLSFTMFSAWQIVASGWVLITKKFYF